MIVAICHSIAARAQSLSATGARVVLSLERKAFFITIEPRSTRVHVSAVGSFSERNRALRGMTEVLL